MNRRFLTFMAVCLGGPLTAFLGCRAVVGIEDLHVGDGGTVTGDTGPSDAGADAATEASIAECAGSDRGACGHCCRDKYFAGNPILESFSKTCVCGGGRCNGTCDASICSGTAPPSECVTCMDNELHNVNCHAIGDCKNDPTCAPLGRCLEGCP